jgi:haloalkane dehalogenase
MSSNQPTPFQAAATREGVRGARFCEFFLVERHGMQLRGKVYNTLGLNDCPGAQYAGISTDHLKSEFGAVAVVRNGPRFFMMDTLTTAEASDEVVSFDGLEMRLVAVVRIPLSQLSGQAPYTETTIERTTEYRFLANRLVYELVPSTGPSYVMQSYAHLVDDTLTIESLSSLGQRLHLPSGWQYRVRSLDQDLVLRTSGEITVIQDDLENTYQRLDPDTIVSGRA